MNVIIAWMPSVDAFSWHRLQWYKFYDLFCCSCNCSWLFLCSCTFLIIWWFLYDTYVLVFYDLLSVTVHGIAALSIYTYINNNVRCVNCCELAIAVCFVVVVGISGDWRGSPTSSVLFVFVIYRSVYIWPDSSSTQTHTPAIHPSSICHTHEWILILMSVLSLCHTLFCYVDTWPHITVCILHSAPRATGLICFNKPSQVHDRA